MIVWKVLHVSFVQIDTVILHNQDKAMCVCVAYSTMDLYEERLLLPYLLKQILISYQRTF